MGRKIDLNKTAIEHCPRFNECCINKCPLAKEYNKLHNDSSDSSKINKDKCTSKRIRREIGEAFNLPHKGLTNREYSAFKASLSNDNKNTPLTTIKSKTGVTGAKNSSEAHIIEVLENE